VLSRQRDSILHPVRHVPFSPFFAIWGIFYMLGSLEADRVRLSVITHRVRRTRDNTVQPPRPASPVLKFLHFTPPLPVRELVVSPPVSPVRLPFPLEFGLISCVTPSPCIMTPLRTDVFRAPVLPIFFLFFRFLTPSFLAHFS